MILRLKNIMAGHLVGEKFIPSRKNPIKPAKLSDFHKTGVGRITSSLARIAMPNPKGQWLPGRVKFLKGGTIQVIVTQ